VRNPGLKGQDVFGSNIDTYNRLRWAYNMHGPIGIEVQASGPTIYHTPILQGAKHVTDIIMYLGHIIGKDGSIANMIKM